MTSQHKRRRSDDCDDSDPHSKDIDLHSDEKRTITKHRVGYNSTDATSSYSSLSNSRAASSNSVFNRLSNDSLAGKRTSLPSNQHTWARVDKRKREDDSNNDPTCSLQKKPRDSDTDWNRNVVKQNGHKSTTDSKSDTPEKTSSHEDTANICKSVFDRLSHSSSSDARAGTATSRPSRASNRDSDRFSSRTRSAAWDSYNSTHTKTPNRSYSQASRSTKPVVYCYGDSFIGTLFLVDQDVLKVTKFKGASAKGLNNPLSTLHVGEKLLTLLDRNKPENVFIFFGNVDLHINFIYQLQTKGEKAVGPEDFKTIVFKQYTSFLESKVLPRMTHEKHKDNTKSIKQLMISSVILPVVKDKYLELSIKKYTENEQKTGDNSISTPISVSKLLESDKGCNLESRTSMVSDFNKLIQGWCLKYPNVAYIDINQYIVESPNLTVKDEFLDKDPTNIHILWEPTVAFWLKEINKQGITGVNAANITVDLAESAQSYAVEKRQRMERHPITSIVLKDQK